LNATQDPNARAGRTVTAPTVTWRSLRGKPTRYVSPCRIP